MYNVFTVPDCTMTAGYVEETLSGNLGQQELSSKRQAF